MESFTTTSPDPNLIVYDVVLTDANGQKSVSTLNGEKSPITPFLIFTRRFPDDRGTVNIAGNVAYRVIRGGSNEAVTFVSVDPTRYTGAGGRIASTDTYRLNFNDLLTGDLYSLKRFSSSCR